MGETGLTISENRVTRNGRRSYRVVPDDTGKRKKEIEPMKNNSVPASDPVVSNLAAPRAPSGNIEAASAAGFAANRENLLAIATCGITELAKKSSEGATARLHGYHSMIYVVAAFAGHAVLSMLGGVFGPFIPLYDLACFAGFAFLLWKAWQGHPTTFPILSEIARKQAGVHPEPSKATTH